MEAHGRLAKGSPGSEAQVAGGAGPPRGPRDAPGLYKACPPTLTSSIPCPFPMPMYRVSQSVMERVAAGQWPEPRVAQLVRQRVHAGKPWRLQGRCCGRAHL